MQKVKLNIIGMHCTSCAMNIDGELEDTKGVKEASTSYAKHITEVEYDEMAINHEKIIATIRSLDDRYDAKIIDKT